MSATKMNGRELLELPNSLRRRREMVGSKPFLVNLRIILTKPCVVILSKQVGMHIKMPELYHKSLI